MPLILSMPVSVGEPIVVQTITGYSVDLINMVLTLQIESIDDNGKSVKTEMKKSRLVTPLGAPRFTENERTVNKAAIYRIGIEDGHLPAGTIV